MPLMYRQSLMQFAAPVCETVVDAPVPQGGEVLLRVEKCGLCHSDLHLQDGFFDAGGGQRIDITRGIKLPFTLGHEIVGTIEAIGPDAPHRSWPRPSPPTYPCRAGARCPAASPRRCP